MGPDFRGSHSKTPKTINNYNTMRQAMNTETQMSGLHQHLNQMRTSLVNHNAPTTGCRPKTELGIPRELHRPLLHDRNLVITTSLGWPTQRNKAKKENVR